MKRGSHSGGQSRFFKSAYTPVRGGFTLIEIMIVVAIMAVVMTMSVPLVYKIWHKEAMRQAVSDVVEVYSHARAQAIMTGQEVDVFWHPKENRLEVSGGSAPSPAESSSIVQLGNTSPLAAGSSATISPDISIEMLDINLTEFKEAEMGRIRFYPNGTCDESTLILHSNKADMRQQDSWRKISLEVTTSLASVETDPNRFK